MKTTFIAITLASATLLTSACTTSRDGNYVSRAEARDICKTRGFLRGTLEFRNCVRRRGDATPKAV